MQVFQKEKSIQWRDIGIRFILTPCDSKDGMCISIENMQFTGETIMPYNAYFTRRDSNVED